MMNVPPNMMNVAPNVPQMVPPPHNIPLGMPPQMMPPPVIAPPNIVQPLPPNRNRNEDHRSNPNDYREHEDKRIPPVQSSSSSWRREKR